MMKIFIFTLSILSIITLIYSCKEQSIKLELDSNRYNVAFLITDGVYNTELTAPYDIFQHTQYRQGIKSMNVFTVSNKSDLVKTFEGMYIRPDFNLLKDKLPKIDILVVPSAEHHLDTDLENKDLISFIRRTSEEAMFVTSHCDGAFMLAKAGIIDKVASTTFPSDVPKYKEMFPHLNVKDSVIFVHDGKFITSAGGAKSFDAALYLTELLYGDSIARSIANGLVIDWKLDEVARFVKEN